MPSVAGSKGGPGKEIREAVKALRRDKHELEKVTDEVQESKQEGGEEQ